MLVYDSNFLLLSQNIRLFIYLWYDKLLESIKPEKLT